jgi:hypothetical protein
MNLNVPITALALFLTVLPVYPIAKRFAILRCLLDDYQETWNFWYTVFLAIDESLLVRALKNFCQNPPIFIRNTKCSPQFKCVTAN